MEVEFVGLPLPPHHIREHVLEAPSEVASDLDWGHHHPRKVEMPKKQSNKYKHKSDRHVSSSSEESNLPPHTKNPLWALGENLVEMRGNLGS